MATETVTNEMLLERAQAAANVARQAADQAQAYVNLLKHGVGPDAVAAAAHAASGGAIDPFVFRLATFVLACVVGYYIVLSVTPALHVPLMSVTNAISSVIVVGALLAVGVDASGFANDGPIWARIFGFFALILASANIVGGFLITERMLSTDEKE